MNPATRIALLVIAHGSRRPEANADLIRVCEALRSRGRYSIVEPAYLELAEPNIATGAAACVAAGATEVILLPFFLSPGRHAAEDLAAARDELRRAHPTVRFELADSLGSHPLILEALEDRARATLPPPSPPPHPVVPSQE